MTYPIDVTQSGAVLLGTSVACDGFHFGARVRVQSHVHDDHMTEFTSSKGLQDIVTSKGTHDLLIHEFDADLPYRSNVYALNPGETSRISDVRITMLPSGHMLGAVQTVVETAGGIRLGYSGDFQWPLAAVLSVEALVIDSTYGSPARRREYSQEEANERLVELVRKRYKHGPIHIHAHRGTLQRGVQLLGSIDGLVMVASDRLCRELQVYRNHGFAIDDVVPEGSPNGRAIVRGDRFVRLYGKGDRLPVDHIEGSTIVLSAYMAKVDDPVLEYSERSFRVALSDHADFAGTLEYVRASGARYVVADNTRGGHGVELAIEIKRRLGIEAVPSSNVSSLAWGV
jgi:putative mRNA 3-end processing factor